MIVAIVTATDGKVSAIPATHWTPVKRKIMEAGAVKADDDHLQHAVTA